MVKRRPMFARAHDNRFADRRLGRFRKILETLDAKSPSTLQARRDCSPACGKSWRSALDGEAYFALAMEWRVWRGLRSFPRRPLKARFPPN